jgi:pimeloyl-ACP methyl ester carboxylesterase
MRTGPGYSIPRGVDDDVGEAQDWPLADAKRALAARHSPQVRTKRRVAAPTRCGQELRVKTIAISYRPVDGIDVRVSKSDAGHAETLILTCPWPESIYAFESTWTVLSERMNLVAIDLPGFGGSERRDELLTPRTMGGFLVRLMDQWEIESPHVFAPDVGTSAALFAAGQNPGRVRSLIVGSGAASFPLQIGGGLKDLVEAPDLTPLAAMDPRDIVASSLALVETYELSPEAREDYLSSYEGDRFVESCRYVRSYGTELPVLGDLLPEIQTPVLVLQGGHDPYVPPTNAEYLHGRLPNSKLHEFDAGHFFWEDAGEEFAALASAWVGGHYHDVA